LLKNGVGYPQFMENWYILDLVNDYGDWKVAELQDLLPYFYFIFTRVDVLSDVILNKHCVIPLPCIEEGPKIKYWFGENKDFSKPLCSFLLFYGYRPGLVSGLKTGCWVELVVLLGKYPMKDSYEIKWLINSSK
jgi:hypothetical protein